MSSSKIVVLVEIFLNQNLFSFVREWYCSQKDYDEHIIFLI